MQKKKQGWKCVKLIPTVQDSNLTYTIKTSVGEKRHLVPEDVSNAKAAHRRQTPRPAGIPMVGGPHLDDDEGQNSGVLRERKGEVGKIHTLKKSSTLS